MRCPLLPRRPDAFCASQGNACWPKCGNGCSRQWPRHFPAEIGWSASSLRSRGLKSHPSDSRITSRRQRENCARPSTVVPHPHRTSLNKHTVPIKFLVQSPLAVRPDLSGNTFSHPDGILAKYNYCTISVTVLNVTVKEPEVPVTVTE